MLLWLELAYLSDHFCLYLKLFWCFDLGLEDKSPLFVQSLLIRVFSIHFLSSRSVTSHEKKNMTTCGVREAGEEGQTFRRREV